MIKDIGFQLNYTDSDEISSSFCYFSQAHGALHELDLIKLSFQVRKCILRHHGLNNIAVAVVSAHLCCYEN